MHSSSGTTAEREPRLIHRSVYMINNAIGINYHYSARLGEPSDGLIHVMIHDTTYIHVYERTFMFPKGLMALTRKKMTVNRKEFLNFGPYLNVVCRTWGEVSQQCLWYVQVLCHLCEGGIWVRTHLLVPTGTEAIWINVFLMMQQNFLFKVKAAEKNEDDLMTYPSILLESGGMVQDSRIPFEPTASPSSPEGGPGAAGYEKKVKKR